jgi:sarcosine oxidase subunit alpha
MCDESGMMVDDGVAARLAPDRFYVTTTSGASDAVAREMTRWALIWSLQVMVLNLTGAYGAMNLAGPRSIEVLQPLTDIDLAPQAFPYLGVRQGRVAGAPARVLRVGFVGEWGYEIHLPADTAVGVWDRILEAGRGAGIRPFGVEAQRLLRLEKGHLIMGQDSDGLSYPAEAGMDWAVKGDKPFFLGQRSLSILKTRPLKRRLVGFAFPEAYGGPVPRECELVIHGGEIAGRVTSAAFSPTLKQVIGLAYVHPELSAPGTPVRIRIGGRWLFAARVVELPFYDPGNLRQKQAPARISHRGA